MTESDMVELLSFVMVFFFVVLIVGVYLIS